YFETTAEIELFACATGRSEVIPLLHSAQPKLVLLDLDIAWEDVCSLLDEIHKNRDTRSLVMCDVVEGSRIIQALRHGANGVLPRRTTHGLFVKSIQAVLKGEFWVSRDMMTDFVHFIRQNATATNDSPRLPELDISRFGLTPRELQMVRALVEGQTNKDIAGTFGISEYTVKH